MQVPPPPDSTNPTGQPWQAPSSPNNQMRYPNPQSTPPPLPPDSTGQSWQTAAYNTESDRLTMPSSRSMASSPNNQMGYANVAPPPPSSYPYNSTTPSGEYTAPTFGTNPQIPPPSAKPRNAWKIATLVLSLLVVLLLISTTALTYALVHTGHNTTTGSTSPGNTPVAQAPSPVPTTAPTTSTTPVYATATGTTSATGSTPVVPQSANSYTATQPGPGCDLGGGTWTPQGPIGTITCGTQITIKADQGRGYLALQLPGNKAFSPNNTISVTGSIGYDNYTQIYSCIGLAELTTGTGYLVEYCNTGAWFIYSISSTGAIIQTLSKNITSTRSTETLSLMLKGSVLTFSIDTEVYTVATAVIQPARVAITAYEQYANNQITVGNFSYLAQ